MGDPQIIHFWMGFSIVNQPFWGSPIYDDLWKPPNGKGPPLYATMILKHTLWDRLNFSFRSGFCHPRAEIFQHRLDQEINRTCKRTPWFDNSKVWGVPHPENCPFLQSWGNTRLWTHWK